MRSGKEDPPNALFRILCLGKYSLRSVHLVNEELPINKIWPGSGNRRLSWALNTCTSFQKGNFSWACRDAEQINPTRISCKNFFKFMLIYFNYFGPIACSIFSLTLLSPGNRDPAERDGILFHIHSV